MKDERAEMKCDTCGETKMCRYLPDPYIDEILPGDPNPPKWWCDECYDRRADDI